MTPEKKIREYDNALDAARRMYASMKENGDFEGTKNLETIFPVLKENEDEKIKREIIEYIKTGTYHKDWLAWLEKQGEQNTAEWSEEDEENMDVIIGFLENSIIDTPPEYTLRPQIEKLVTWIKSLKPQNRWKPSKKQMDALTAAYNFVEEQEWYNENGVLITLINDIKKTMTMDRYEEALKRAKEFVGNEECINLEYIFPELKESEDERIRKSLIKSYVNAHSANFPTVDGFSREQIIAWLEKQGNTNETINRDVSAQAVLRGAAIDLMTWMDYNAAEGNMRLSNIECKDIEDALAYNNWDKIYAYMKKKLEKQGEQKHVADKSEPKFKVGKWYQCTKDFFGKGVNFDKNTAYYCAQEGCLQDEYGCHIAIVKELYDNFKLWDISDAQAGDVLYDGSNACIFRKKMEDDDAIWVDTYCGINSDGMFNVNDEDECWCLACDCAPATKEQREQLEKAMTDAGYTFDFDKKELKVVEKNPAWSEEDDVKINRIVAFLENLKVADNDIILKDIDWLKSIKEKVLPKNEWSEEDENRFRNLIYLVEHSDEGEGTKEGFVKFINRLKSLKPQNTWKPSDEQMKVLISEVEGWTKGCPKQKVLESLYNDLKNLK